MLQITHPGDLDALLATLPVADQTAAASARVHQATLTKPPGSLGRLEDIAAFMAAWQGTANPQIVQARAIIFAGNHGVCAQGVNAYPQSVTAAMVANFQSGGAAINQLCRSAGAELTVIPLDLDCPTADFTQAPAMTTDDLVRALNQGMQAVRRDTDILILGEMGIGNSTVAAALSAALYGGDAAAWVGPGTGADPKTDAEAGITRKIAAVNAGLQRHRASSGKPLAILQSYGGREQAALCGAILAARLQRTPVILDGFICTSAAAILHALNPTVLDHCLAGHISSEPGHRLLLEKIGKHPLLDLGMRLGEGSGAALALAIVRAALACHNGMATFADAGIADR